MSQYGILPAKVPKIVSDLFSATVAQLKDVPVPVRDLQNPERADNAFLTLLAWGFGMRVWDDQAEELVKRDQIKAWPEIAKRMGTRGAVRRGLDGLSLPYEITEWFEQNPQEEPGTFCIDVAITNTDPIPEKLQRSLVRTVQVTKKLSAHYCIRFNTDVETTAYLGATVKTGVIFQLPPAQEPEPVQVGGGES